MSEEFGDDIICPNCGISAYDFFVYILNKEVPKHFYEGMNWFCCAQCYDERRKDEG